MTYRDMWATLNRVVSDPLMSSRVVELKGIVRQMAGWILASEVVLTLQPYPIKWFFDGLLKEWPPRTMYTLCSGLLVIYVIGTWLHSKQASLRHRFFHRVWANAWGYSHLREMKLDTSWHVRHSTGDKESLVIKNVGRMLNLVDEVVYNTLPSAMRIALTSIGVWWLGLHFGGLVLITIVAFVLAMLKTERVMEPFRKQAHRSLKFLERQGTEINKNWRTIKQMGIENEMCQRHWSEMDTFCEQEHERNTVFNRHWKTQESTITVARVLLYASLYHFYDPGSSVGAVILATHWMERVFSNFYRLDDFQRRLNEGLEAARELCEVLSIVPEIRQPEHPLWPEDGIRGNFELTGMSFSFPNSTEEALTNLNLGIRANEFLAIVGRTGSGKSTLASLLMREYTPTSGTITLDGIPLAELDNDRYRREAVSVVSQKIDLFDGSILENIRIARPDATFDEVREAAQEADAHEFITSKEHGYDSQIGEDGIQLSGGQRQRIAIARAFVRRPSILILDEATSSLDGDSQAEVQKAVDRLISGRQATIVVIAHRLSTVRKADRIVVLDQGRIVEIGTHTELHAHNGLYRHFIERELEGYAVQV